MEKEIVLMEVTKKTAQNQFVQKANFLAKILTAALEQPVLILNGFVMAKMIVVTGRMKPQTSAYHVHVNRIGENHLLFLYIFSSASYNPTKVPILKECHFGKMKL